MPAAIALAFSDLFTPAVLRILGKSLLVTLLAFIAVGAGAWYLLDAAILRFGGSATGDFSGILAAGGAVLLLWVLWAVIAFTVIQFFADDVVAAVEARHYPAVHSAARPLGIAGEAAMGIKTGAFALAVNLLALPVALVLLVTGVGTVVVFWLANTVVLGRELSQMVAVRHRANLPRQPLGRVQRFALGGLAAGMLLVPVANLLSPVFGAAVATHLIHRQRGRHAS